MKTRIVVRVPVEMLKAIKPAPGQLSMFGGTQPVVVKPHTRTTPSGQAAQVSGYTEQRRSAAEKPHEPRMARLSPERVQQLERLASRKTPVESTPVKEPHEISRLELGTRNVTSMHPKHPLQWEGLDGKLRYADTDEELQKLRSDDFDRHQRLVSRAIRDGKHVPPHVIADYPDLKPNETENPKEPHETTRAEYAKGVTVSRGNNYLAVKGDGGDFVIRSLETSKYSDSDAIGHAHEERIRTALAAGKPVPPHVLADYPDLKPKEPEKPKATTRLTDADRWHRMRNLGVKWPKNRAIPTFPSTMTDEAKREASELHDSMSDQFVSGFGQFEQQRGKLPFRKSLRLVIRKSLVHAYQRRAPSGQSVQVGEYSNKVQKKPTMPSQGHPLWAGASLPPQKPRQPVAPTRAPTRAVVRTRPGTAPPLRPTQAHYKPGLQKPGPSIGETSSGAVIHADSHRVHAGWSKTDHFEAAQAHKDQVAKLERRHQQSDPFEGELGAPAHPDAESEQATAHRARAAYHSRMADGDSKGAAAIAKYDHRFGEHLEGHQAEEQQPVSGALEPVESDPTVPPSKGQPYTPELTRDDNGDGVPDYSRVGVPADHAPPPPPIIPRLPNLTEDERGVEDRFASAFEKDPDGVAQAYLDKLAAAEIGDAPNIFNTDDAKMLSGDYNPQGVPEEEVLDARSRTNVLVHQTSNAIAKRAFLKYLDDLPEDKKTVLVTSGGVASGKGHSIGQVGKANELAQSVGAVWDAAGEQNATENPWILRECKKRGIRATFVFVHADPTQTWENPKRGVIERAQKKGRMVDARLFADSYVEGPANFKKFYDANVHDPDADFIFIENLTTPKELEQFPEEALKVNAEELYARASKHIDGLEHIKPAVRRGGTIGRRIWAQEKTGFATPAQPEAERGAPGGDRGAPGQAADKAAVRGPTPQAAEQEGRRVPLAKAHRLCVRVRR